MRMMGTPHGLVSWALVTKAIVFPVASCRAIFISWRSSRVFKLWSQINDGCAVKAWDFVLPDIAARPHYILRWSSDYLEITLRYLKNPLVFMTVRWCRGHRKNRTAIESWLQCRKYHMATVQFVWDSHMISAMTSLSSQGDDNTRKIVGSHK